MNFNTPIGIIELGNVEIKCLIFKINQDNTSEILSTSISQSEGIHNGVIINLKKASSAIRSCIGEAEKKSEVHLKKINVIVEQPEFLCTKFSKSRKINGSKIYKEDIEFLLKEGKKQITLNDKNQTIIHIFNYNYTVDDKKFIKEPIGVYANYLKHEMTFVTAPKNNLKNITLSNSGLSNSCSTAHFDWIPIDNPGGSGLSNNPMGIPPWFKIETNKVPVKLITIDSLQLNKLDFIKLDVEGYETFAISGGFETIKKYKPIITLESWANHNGDVDINFTQKVFRSLIDIGYNLIHINGPDFLFVPI